jgi:hypothetical protein
MAYHHILALKSSTKFFDEVLKPLQIPPIISKTLDFANTCDGIEIDDNSSTKDIVLLGLCE